MSLYEGILKLATGAGVSKLIGLALLPVVTRLYTPTQIGELNLAIAIATILVPLATLTYHIAIPLPKTENTAQELQKGTLLLITLFCSIACLVVGILYSIKTIWSGAWHIWYWLMPLLIFFASVKELLTMSALRNRLYSDLAQAGVRQVTIGELLKIGLSLTGGTIALFLATIISYIFNARHLERKTHTLKTIKNKRFIYSKTVRTLKNYSTFPITRLPSQLLLGLSSQSPLLISAMLFDSATLGKISLALIIVATPASLLAASIGKAAYAETSKLSRKEPKKIYEIAIDLQKKIILIGTPITLSIYFIAEPMFNLAFDSEWSDTGTYISIMSLLLITQVSSAPLMQIITIYNNQSVFLAVNALRLMSISIVAAVCYQLNYSPFEFIKLYTALMVIFYLGTSLYIVRFLKIKCYS